jgi:hypothetical protein
MSGMWIANNLDDISLQMLFREEHNIEDLNKVASYLFFVFFIAALAYFSAREPSPFDIGCNW